MITHSLTLRNYFVLYHQQYYCNSQICLNKLKGTCLRQIPVYKEKFNFLHWMNVCLMVFNATFNNISVISWRSVLLLEETRGSGENHRPVSNHWQTLSQIVVHLALIERFELTTSVVIDNDYIHCKDMKLWIDQFLC